MKRRKRTGSTSSEPSSPSPKEEKVKTTPRTIQVQLQKHSKTGLEMTLLVCPYLTRIFQAQINNMLGLKNSNITFPAGQPIALDAKTLQNPMSLSPPGQFHASGKADGTQYLLLFTSIQNYSQKYQVLIGRDWSMWLLKFSIPSCYYEGTLLLGEWVFEPKDSKFLVFDIYYSCGSSLLRFPHSQRLEVTDKITQHILDEETTGDCPFRVVTKKFYPVGQTMSIQEIVDTCQKQYATDGLIFTDKTSMVSFFTDNATFKYKPKYWNTVDFFIDTPSGSSIAHLAVRNRVVVRQQLVDLLQCSDCEKAVVEKLVPRICSESSSLCGSIVECFTCPFKRNIWHAKCVRHDKVEPNSEFVFKHTFSVIQEGVTLEDLKRALDRLQPT